MVTDEIHSLALRLRDIDNVAVATRAIPAGTELDIDNIRLTARTPIKPGHKIAITNIQQDQPILKYGQTIGFARVPITAGEHVHSHNIVAGDFARDYEFCIDARPVEYYPAGKMRYFDGFSRPGGRVGTRNYVAIISSVNCSASVSQYVAQKFRTPEFRRDFPNIDGVVPFTYKGGCGIPLGEPVDLLKRVLAGIATHPNIFGYVMIGLGCETNQITPIRSEHSLDVLKPGQPAPAFMTIQDKGGVRKTVDAAADAIRKLLPLANEARRTRQPISKLILALNCGGSDGNSGITANPALGVASDELVRYGGTSVLAETPEIYGAEHLLTRRAISREVGEKLVSFIRWWENHAKANGAHIDNNPSWGNKEGGLTTIYEKSLGAVSKGGLSPLAAVYKYAQQIDTPGFGFMDTPGFDPVSMTGLVSGGCTVGCFTTGRGSAYGCKPSPCIKITTNTAIFEQMSDDMDLNAGIILDGTESLHDVGMRIFEKIIAVASGERTKSELEGIGDEEFAPWMLGPVF